MDSIGLSTAAFCLWEIPPAEKLRIGHQLGFEHIEIALSTASMVRNFSELLSQAPLSFRFKHVALHAPWHGVAYGQNAKSRKLMAQLEEIVRRLEIESVVIHCDCIVDPEVLAGSGLPICLENSATPDSWDRFSAYLNEYPWQVSLNLNKASRENGHLDSILDRWRHRIERVHLSGHMNSQGRMPLQSTRQFHLIESIQNLEVPWILEGLFPPGDHQFIERERQMVQAVFQSLRVSA